MDASSGSWVLGCSSNLYPFNQLGCRYTSSRLTTIGQQLPADKGKCTLYPSASSWELRTSASAGKMEGKCMHAILNCQTYCQRSNFVIPYYLSCLLPAHSQVIKQHYQLAFKGTFT